MTTLPKPVALGPRPRRQIQRKARLLNSTARTVALSRAGSLSQSGELVVSPSLPLADESRLPARGKNAASRKRIVRRSPVPRVSNRPAARLTRLNDAIWRERVKRRANGLCERCEDERAFVPGTDAHHLISRRYKATRHELSNGVLLCRWHHTGGPISAHAMPLEFKWWFMHTFRDRWAALMEAREKSR